MKALSEKLEEAQELSWDRFGKQITFYLPGMFSHNGVCGKYPAVSITGDHCALQCDHCRGALLRPMMSAATPQTLKEACLRFAGKGDYGVLISGGCDEEGRLPWENFCDAIAEIKQATGLYVSVHSGLIDYTRALRLKEAGVDQALIDVIGDDETYQSICHVPFGVSQIISSLEALQKAALPVIPHIVCGLNYGKLKGETSALAMLTKFEIEQLVIVSLMRIPGTPSWQFDLPSAEQVGEIVAEARLALPHTLISLGCARQRGGDAIDRIAIDAGVNRMALPSDEAIQAAIGYGLEITYQKTCCSVGGDCVAEQW